MRMRVTTRDLRVGDVVMRVDDSATVYDVVAEVGPFGFRYASVAMMIPFVHRDPGYLYWIDRPFSLDEVLRDLVRVLRA
jgi:hypothetical protein